MYGPVTGISEHNGWAECVTVGLDGARPVVVDRRRVELVEPGLPQNPYHHEGLVLPLADAGSLIGRVRASVQRCCHSALADLASSFGVRAIVLQESPYGSLPSSVAQVLASYPLTCAADGMMYRETLAESAIGLGLSTVRVPRKGDRFAAAAVRLGVDREALVATVAQLGAELGAPWRREHQEAAANALGVLAGQAPVSLNGLRSPTGSPRAGQR